MTCFQNILMIIQLKYFRDSLNIVVSLALDHWFFNIYRTELNDGHFFCGTVITHFLENFFQEINFKSHWNSLTLCK